MSGPISNKVSSLLNAAAARSELENLISEHEALVEQNLNVVESWGKSVGKEVPKHSVQKNAAGKSITKEPARLSGLFKGIGTNVAQDWLKAQGGFWKFSAWMWQGAELGGTIGSVVGGTVAWPIALIECGAFAADVWEERIKAAKAEALEDAAKKLDRIVMLHTEVAQRLRSSGQKLFKSCEALPTRIVPFWTEGGGKKCIMMLSSGKGHPSGRALLLTAAKKTLMTHLLELDHARYELYLLGTTCEAMVKHGAHVLTDHSNAACGLPDYKGFHSPYRGQLIHAETSQLTGIVKQCAGCNGRLANTSFNLWSTIGSGLKISKQEASPWGLD